LAANADLQASGLEESVTFQNDELNRLVSLVQYR
jgi:hypothetical protein